ncbi:PITH1 protein, partial [Leptocoma aspasia]|nr:PITH1 protein [Leptocoma aspasia]
GAAMAHGHGPGRCRCCGEEAAERGAAWGLYLRIDRQRLQCLNERREGSGATVFRPWEERGDRSQFVESDDDEELLFNIPFTGSVKLKGVIVMGEEDGTHPAELRLFRNIPHMSFDDTAKEPEQTFSLSQDPLGELEYPTKIARFSNVYHLSMHFPKNFGAETTKIFYIGLKGEWTEVSEGRVREGPGFCFSRDSKPSIPTQAHRHQVTICNYEASANPADHKLEQITPQTHFIS